MVENNGQQVQQIGQTQQGQGTYPGNQDEVQQFIVDITNALYSDGHVEQMLNMVKKNPDNVGQIVGQIAGSIIVAVLQRRMKQNGGRKPHAKLVMNGLKMVLENMAEIIATSGMKKATPKDMQVAAKIAGQVIDKGFVAQGGQPQQGQAGNPQQIQQQPQPRGMLG